MTVREQLIGNKTSYDVNIPMLLKDVVTQKFLYCGKGYAQMIEEMDEAGANGRFLYDRDDKDCIILYYIKELEYYHDNELANAFKTA